MKRLVYCTLALSLLTTGQAKGQDDHMISYEVSFPNAAHHEAEIEVAFKSVPAGPFTVQMSRASPGRYAIHEFAKNVYNVKATTPEGRALALSRKDPYSWVIDDHRGEVIVSYTLYADRADGTYSQIDLTHAHLNAPATFLWGKGLDDRPVEVRFTPPNREWKAVTQLEATRPAMTFRAPDLQYFMDSPIELSNQDIRSWRLEDGQTLQFAVHHAGTSEDVTRIVEKTKKVIAEQIRVFGEAPRFDFGTYTFIADYVPHASRDGMEHRNSTIVTRPDGLYQSDFAHLGTISHEFFHSWNVERIRPEDLEPFDFTEANPSASLWFAEGFTSYYGPLTIRRAGEQSIEDYLSDLAGTLSGVVNAPGRKIYGPADMSLRAPFIDAAASIDPTNNANIFVSYYPYGAMVALALDIILRDQFKGVTLDDYMKLIWRTHGKTEKPYTNSDLKAALAELTGDANFADTFFARHVYEGELPDYTPLLARAGLVLEPSGERAWIGDTGYDEVGKSVFIAANTRRDTPLYKAGLDRGDEIIRIGRFQIQSADDIKTALNRYKPGDKLDIEFIQRGLTRRSMLKLVTDPGLQIRLMDEPTEAHLSFRRSWLGVQ